MTSIREIAVGLPPAELTNEQLAKENPGWAMDAVTKRVGIDARRVTVAGETAFDLSVRACEELIERPGFAVEDVDAILYCTHDPDYPMPGNAHLLHAHLGLGDCVLALDYRLACSGFVYGLGIADSLCRAGAASGVLLVTAETPSKRINPRDRSARVIFGDGAAVTYLSANDDDGGRVVGYELCSHGAAFEQGYVPAGGARSPSSEETKRETTDISGNVRTDEDLRLAGPRLWGFVNSTIPAHVEGFLAKRSLSLEDIDLYIFHQASQLVLGSLNKALQIPPERLFRHMKDIGNLSSASIPFALHAALSEGAVPAGSRLLLCGFGTGISYGSAIVEFA